VSGSAILKKWGQKVKGQGHSKGEEHTCLWLPVKFCPSCFSWSCTMLGITE